MSNINMTETQISQFLTWAVNQLLFPAPRSMSSAITKTPNLMWERMVSTDYQMAYHSTRDMILPSRKSCKSKITVEDNTTMLAAA